ncbi:MAG: hypothetical protein JEY99_05910 [Spirochaetales bacterium]|nr:hypothetical protein [Spirochaetales bacterium]
MESVIQFILEKFYYVFLGLLGAYVIIKFRNRHSNKKRILFFVLAIGVFVVYTGTILIHEAILPQWTFLLICLAAIGGAAYFIRKFWIFRMDCSTCGKRMDWNTIVTDDRNLCSECLDAALEAEDGVDAPAEANTADDADEARGVEEAESEGSAEKTDE